MAKEYQTVYRDSSFVPIKTGFKANDERVIIGWNYIGNRREEGSFPEFHSNPDEISGFSDPVNLYACWGYQVQISNDEHSRITVSPDHNPDETIKKFLPNESAKFDVESDNGYSLEKWGDGSSECPRTEKITQNKTLSVKSKINTYKIAYNLNGGTNDPSNPDSYTVETPTITLKDASRTDYNFKGWSPTNVISCGSYGDKTFDAIFELKQRYDVSLGTSQTYVAPYNGHLKIYHSGGNGYGSYGYWWSEGHYTTDSWWTNTDHVKVYVNGVLVKQITGNTFSNDDPISINAGDTITTDILTYEYYKAVENTGETRWVRNGWQHSDLPGSIGYITYYYYL